MYKILHLVTSLNQGGLETYLLRYIKYDCDAEHTIICKSGVIGELENDFLKQNCKIIPLRVGYFSLVSFYKLLGILKRGAFDAICDYTGNFSGIPMFLAYCAKIKVRITFHRGSSNHFKEDYLRLLYNYFVKKLGQKFSTVILSNSYAALNFFYGTNFQDNIKYKVVYNGVENFNINEGVKKDLKRELGIPLHGFVVGHVGRYSCYKNQDTILNVAINLCSKYSDMYFVFVGRDVEKALQSQISSYDFKNRILFLGYRRDVKRILSIFDVFYFPSTSEGQPNALIEAMIAGLPVITSNIDSIKETTPTYFHDFLIDPNDINGAVKIIETFYLNPDYKQKYILSEWARLFFSTEKRFGEFKFYLRNGSFFCD